MQKQLDLASGTYIQGLDREGEHARLLFFSFILMVLILKALV